MWQEIFRMHAHKETTGNMSRQLSWCQVSFIFTLQWMFLLLRNQILCICCFICRFLTTRMKANTQLKQVSEDVEQFTWLQRDAERCKGHTGFVLQSFFYFSCLIQRGCWNENGLVGLFLIYSVLKFRPWAAELGSSCSLVLRLENISWTWSKANWWDCSVPTEKKQKKGRKHLLNQSLWRLLQCTVSYTASILP